MASKIACNQLWERDILGLRRLAVRLGQFDTLRTGRWPCDAALQSSYRQDNQAAGPMNSACRTFLHPDATLRQPSSEKTACGPISQLADGSASLPQPLKTGLRRSSANVEECCRRLSLNLHGVGLVFNDKPGAVGANR